MPSCCVLVKGFTYQRRLFWNFHPRCTCTLHLCSTYIILKKKLMHHRSTTHATQYKQDRTRSLNWAIWHSVFFRDICQLFVVVHYKISASVESSSQFGLHSSFPFCLYGNNHITTWMIFSPLALRPTYSDAAAFK